MLVSRASAAAAAHGEHLVIVRKCKGPHVLARGYGAGNELLGCRIVDAYLLFEAESGQVLAAVAEANGGDRGRVRGEEVELLAGRNPGAK